MPANVVNFASHREIAWHGLGTVFEQEITDYAEMLQVANMANRNLRFVDASELMPDVHFVTPVRLLIEDRDGAQRCLAAHGKRYAIVSAEDAFESCQYIAGDGRSWETAGELDNGRKIFGSVALNRTTELSIDGVTDRIENYVLVSTSHDGTLALQFTVTPVRVVCANTLRMALSDAPMSWSRRHVGHGMTEAQRALAREALGLANGAIDQMEIEAQQMIETEMTNSAFFDLVCEIRPRPEENVKGSVTKWENYVEAVTGLWNGPTNANVPPSAWRAFNVLTEEDQWFRQVRSPENGGVENFYAAGAGFDNRTNSVRESLYAKVRQFAGLTN